MSSPIFPESLTLLTLENLAEILQKSPAALYSTYARNKSSLPPRVALPGTRRVYFRRSDVEKWLAKHVVMSTIAEGVIKRGPGRPTKKEQVARQFQIGGGQ